MDRNLITEYTNICKTIKDTNSKMKVLRARLRDLDKKICKEMHKSNLEVINLSQGGKLVKKQTKRKSSVCKKVILEKIRQEIDGTKADRLIDKLYENREITNVEKLFYKQE